MNGDPYDQETRDWIDAAQTPKELQSRKNRAKYLRHKEKIKAARRLDYANDPEKYAKRSKIQRKRHAPKIKADKLEYERQDRAKNPEKYREKQRKHREENTVYYRKKWADYRAMKLQRKPSWANDFFIEEAYALAKLRTEMTGFPWEVDHIIPLQGELISGLHVENNLQVIPQSVNRVKSNKWL